jgi:hypothetical protein
MMGAIAPAQLDPERPMSANNYAYTLTPGGPTGARSFCMIAAAIAAVCVVSSAVVMRELVGPQPASATTAAAVRTWDLEPRWWPGEIRQVTRPASSVPDSDLTFAKGYQLRLAARQAASSASAARLAATGPSVESQFGRSAVVVRKATTFARTDGAPNPRRVSAAHIDAPVYQPGRPDVGNHALAYGEQQPSQRGIAEARGGPFGHLFGNLY